MFKKDTQVVMGLQQLAKELEIERTRRVKAESLVHNAHAAMRWLFMDDNYFRKYDNHLIYNYHYYDVLTHVNKHKGCQLPSKEDFVDYDKLFIVIEEGFKEQDELEILLQKVEKAKTNRKERKKNV